MVVVVVGLAYRIDIVCAGSGNAGYFIHNSLPPCGLYCAGGDPLRLVLINKNP